MTERLADAERRGLQRGREEGTRAYQGLQRTLSQTQGELARAQANAAKLDMIPALVRSQQALLERTVGPEEARAFAQSLENETLKAQLAAAQTQPQPIAQPYAPAPPAAQTLSPEQLRTAKQQVIDGWYPGLGITAEDPSIDWAQGVADPTEAQRLFHSSVAKAVAAKAADVARATSTTEATQHANEILVRAGAETTDGGLPNGAPQPQPLDADPKNWRPRDLFARGYEASGDPHAKLVERQARRTGAGAEGGPVVRTK